MKKYKQHKKTLEEYIKEMRSYNVSKMLSDCSIKTGKKYDSLEKAVISEIDRAKLETYAGNLDLNQFFYALLVECIVNGIHATLREIVEMVEDSSCYLSYKKGENGEFAIEWLDIEENTCDFFCTKNYIGIKEPDRKNLTEDDIYAEVLEDQNATYSDYRQKRKLLL